MKKKKLIKIIVLQNDKYELEIEVLKKANNILEYQNKNYRTDIKEQESTIEYWKNKYEEVASELSELKKWVGVVV